MKQGFAMKQDLPQVSAEGPMTDLIDRAPFYHDGMRELQDRFDGRRVADGSDGGGDVRHRRTGLTRRPGQASEQLTPMSPPRRRGPIPRDISGFCKVLVPPSVLH